MVRFRHEVSEVEFCGEGTTAAGMGVGMWPADTPCRQASRSAVAAGMDGGSTWPVHRAGTEGGGRRAGWRGSRIRMIASTLTLTFDVELTFFGELGWAKGDGQC